MHGRTATVLNTCVTGWRARRWSGPHLPPLAQDTVFSVGTRIFTVDLPSFDPIDCLIYRAIAEEKYHIPLLNASPLPFMHTDLNPGNFLVLLTMILTSQDTTE